MHRRESFEEDDSVAEQAERRAKVHCTPFLNEDFKEFRAIWTKLGHHEGFLSDPSPIMATLVTHKLTNSLTAV